MKKVATHLIMSTSREADKAFLNICGNALEILPNKAKITTISGNIIEITETGKIA